MNHLRPLTLGLSFVLGTAIQALAQSCPVYHISGPITVAHDNQVIRNLIIRSRRGPAITIDGHVGVRIVNVVIHHNGGPGIAIANARNTAIRNADIIFNGAPPSGPNPSENNNNIDCYNSPGLTVRNVRLTRGSSGIYMNQCPHSRLSLIEGHDQRGPFPRGQLVQWNSSNDGVLTDFSSENSIQRSWTEDNVNVYHSTGITIERGLLDGNNSPSGDGIMVDERSGNVMVQDVDAIHQGNGCFGIYGGGSQDVSYINTRCRDTICTLPRGEPLSGSLAWAIDPRSISGNLNIVNASYAHLCNPDNIVWDATKLTVSDIHRRNFTPRPPLRVKLCRYGY